MASLAGFTSACQIAGYWAGNRKELSEIFPDFPESDISQDTVRRIIMLLGRSRSDKFLRDMTRPPLARCATRSVSPDGLSVRAATVNGTRPPCVFNALDHENGLVLNQVLADVKNSGITHSSPLVEELDLRGCVVASDAMSLQEDFARTLVEEKHCDYCLALNGNHRGLRDSVKFLFDNGPSARQRQTLDGIEGWESKFESTDDDGHGREEKRSVRVLPARLVGKEFY